MTTFDPAVVKLGTLCASRSLWVKAGPYGDYMQFIPDKCFTTDEIKSIKRFDDLCLREQGERAVANFLPDGERPEGVPDYEETLRRAKRSEDDPKRT
ncbi:MAG: hypothetical protein IJM30_10055 [Thermoguttaceae bacterium]|nr:hypothetical protein [Thermoguttaceae bacterium]